MPWSIVEGGGKCPSGQFAVIKKADGSTAGCHSTREAAKKQLAALYVSEKKKRSVRMLTGLPTEERRGLSSATAQLEIRADASGDNPVERFRGYAATFNNRAAIGNPATFGFYEQIAPGAFSKTLQEGDARMLIDHNPYYVVSRASADTLRLSSDKTGLAVDSQLDTDLSYVKDLAANVRNGNITGMSFGFSVIKDDWSSEQMDTVDGDPVDAEVRTLQEVRLVEVSAVTFPAYTQTRAELASVAAALRSRGDVDAIERRAQYRPELLDLCGVTPSTRTIIDLKPSEPRESTRDADVVPDGEQEVEPAASTQQLLRPSIADLNRAVAARYHLRSA